MGKLWAFLKELWHGIGATWPDDRDPPTDSYTPVDLVQQPFGAGHYMPARSKPKEETAG